MTHPNLAKITATLNQLPPGTNPSASGSIAHPHPTPPPGMSQPPSVASPVSFQIHSRSRSTSPRAPQLIATSPAERSRRSVPHAVRPFTPAATPTTDLALPKFKLPHFTHHQNSFNMALPMTLVKQIETQIEAWQVELRHVLTHIQSLYAEGPIVNGWLDPVETPATPTPANAWQTAEPTELLTYVDAICAATPQYSPATIAAEPGVAYQLCGLQSDGRVWCRPCPPEQLPTISLAIARYRKLRLLLQQKEQLELYLQQAAAALVDVHTHLQRLATAS